MLSKLDPVYQIMILYPIVSLLFGIGAQIVLRKLWSAPALVFIVSGLALWTRFGFSYLVWVPVYVVIAFGGALLGKYIAKKYKLDERISG